MNNAFEYFNKTKNNMPRKNVRKFVDMVINPGICIDLGCGAGNDTIFLIKNGWKVIAIDKENTEDIIRNNLKNEEQNYLEFEIQDFENITLKPCNLLVSNLSLSFCDRKYFSELWNKIVNSISREGYFVGNFFGINDTWANRTNMTFFSKEDVLDLFLDFKIIDFDEIERDGKTALGKTKHWHIFNVIAKKI